MHPRRDPLRQEPISWQEVDRLVDVLVPQLRVAGSFDGIVMITRGGIIPGGLLAEALSIRYILTAAVRFSIHPGDEGFTSQSARLAFPAFLQFPDTNLLEDRKLLLVDDVWGSGRTSLSIKGRLEASAARVFTCVFHFNPYRSLFSEAKPDFYGAITDTYVVYPWEVDRGADTIAENTPVF
jgi:hypoxanthine phosphoribosyltransferase